MPSLNPGISIGSSSKTGSIKEKASQWISNISGVTNSLSLDITNSISGLTSSLKSDVTNSITQTIRRRNATCRLLIENHRFETTPMKGVTICSQCRKTIWGLNCQRCKLCKLVCHRNCLSSINSSCLKDENNLLSAQPKHQYKVKTFLTPTFCNHCGLMLVGLYNQGVECDMDKGGCGMVSHEGCKESVCQPCGKNLIEREIEHEIIEPSRISIQDFEIIRILGIGSCGKVYLSRLKDTGQEFAIKVIEKESIDPESAFAEKKVLTYFGRQPTNQFLTMAHCCFQSRDRLFYVMEHVKGRDLLYHLDISRKFTEDRTRFYAAEIVSALMYLHRYGIVYRDLKLENVILDKHGHCKLIDFGMSKELNKSQKTRTFCGTPGYISPEMIRELDYGFSVDWWALGILMYEMLFAISPFKAEEEDEDNEKLYNLILNSEIDYPFELSEEARSILDGLLTKDPTQRLGCTPLEGEQALRDHFFFKKLLNSVSVVNIMSNQRKWWEEIEAKRIRPPYRPTKRDLDEVNDLNRDISVSLEDRIVSPINFDSFSFYSESFASIAQLDDELLNLSLG